MKKSKKIEDTELVRDSAKSLIPGRDKEIMRSLYDIRPIYVNGVAITPVQQSNNYLVRMVFSENNYSIKENVPVCGVILSLDDFINNYQLMTTFLNNLKEHGVIK